MSFACMAQLNEQVQA